MQIAGLHEKRLSWSETKASLFFVFIFIRMALELWRAPRETRTACLKTS
jgi:hypothetical protein